MTSSSRPRVLVLGSSLASAAVAASLARLATVEVVDEATFERERKANETVPSLGGTFDVASLAPVAFAPLPKRRTAAWKPQTYNGKRR